MQKQTSIWPGLALCVAIGIVAWCMAEFIPVVGELVGGPVFAILIGMLLAFVKRPDCFQRGITFSGKAFLQYSIIFIGFGMNIREVIQVGGQSVAVMICTIAASLLTAVLVGKALGITGNTCTLIGVGTSICGGSAIAATAPVIDADDKEVAYSISTIFLFNIAAVFIFPAMGRAMGMSDTGFGVWAGTAINDTSSVVAAGYTFSEAAGSYATIVKLTRTLMIIPITLALALLRSRKAGKGGEYRLSKIFPWFVVGFLAAAIVSTLVSPLGAGAAQACTLLDKLGKFGIIVAMAGIGLNTNLKSLVKNGVRPIALGLCCWIAVALVSLGVQHLVGLV